MSKIASAPQVRGSVARQRGRRAAAPLVGENHLGAVVVEGRRVPVGEVCRRPRRAAPGSPDRRCPAGCRCPSRRRRPGRSPGKTVMSWHWLVTDVRLRAFAVVAALPQAGDGAGGRSVKMRGRLTTRLLRRSSGTWITSMLKSEVLGSSSGVRPEQPASSSPGRPCPCPSRTGRWLAGSWVGDQRVRVRSTAGLDRRDLLRFA